MGSNISPIRIEPGPLDPVEHVEFSYKLFEPDEDSEQAVDKPPVIFLHGLTASNEYWCDIPKTVANAMKRKVYAIDSRNHGDSPWSAEFNFDMNVADLLHFMDTIEAPKAILIGHSMGGITTVKTCCRAPERVEKAIIEDMTVCKIDPQIFDAIYNRMGLNIKAVEAMPNGLDEEKSRQFIMDFVTEASAPEAKQMNKYDEKGCMIPLKKAEDGRYTFKANMGVLQNAVKTAQEVCVSGQYEGPACFIYGCASPFCVCKDEEEIIKLFPNAELVGIDCATHTVHNDCPDAFTEALLSFLLKE